MFGRVSHYYQKARLLQEKQGVGPLLKDAASFLIRRKLFLEFFFESFEYHVLSRFRDPESTIIQFLKKDGISSDRVMLYASYDADSKIGTHVTDQLKAFQDQGYQIIFVSTSPYFLFAEFDKIKTFVSVCVHRRNEGYDFGSWRVAYGLIKDFLPKLDSLIVMNDSCFGPAFDITEILQKMRDAKDLVYGVSISEEIFPHIQSYFYHFGSEVLRKPVAAQFFERIRLHHSKWGIVRYFEIGGSRFLDQHRITIHALVDPMEDPAIKQKMIELNLTEPTRAPLAGEWVRLQMSPFYKRSNKI